MVNVPANVQPGDFFCVLTASEMSKLITIGEWLNGDRFARTTGKRFAHAGIVVSVEYPRSPGSRKRLDMPQISIVEAEPGGVRRCLWHYGPGSIVIWSTGVAAPRSRTAAVARANHMVGTPYGWLNYPAIGAHRLHIPAELLDWYVDSDRSVICSQVVAMCWEAGGTMLFPDRPAGFVTPQQEADWLLARGALPISI